MTEPFIYRQEDAVAIISINDAPYNRMTLDFIDQLEDRIELIAADSGIRALLITAEGDANFSVGMNLKQLPDALKTRGGADGLFDQRLRLISRIENMGKPAVATLYGNCLGGGLELPLGCHFRLAAEEGAQIGLPEMDLGTVPAWGGSARLTRTVGSHHAIDLVLRGKKIDGPEALRIGLVHEVWPLVDLKNKALELAHQLAAQPAVAVKAMLGVMVNGEQRSLEELLVAERAAVKATLKSADAMEGMMAFLEKRAPIFNQPK